MTSPSPWSFRAGPAALEILRDRGLTPETLGGIVGPASGPRWLVLADLDRALMASGLLDRGAKVLSGASAGAWRMLALASPRRLQVHAELLERYVTMAFPPKVRPEVVSQAYRDMLDDLFPAADRPALLGDQDLTLALHVVLARGPAASSVRSLHLAGVFAAGFPRLLSRSIERLPGLTRVVASNRPLGQLAGLRTATLDPDTLIDFALGSGTVPWYMEPVTAPAPLRGRLLDGGLTDYHFRTPLAPEGIILVPHFTGRLLPTWFDQFRDGRAPDRRLLDRVLLISPSPELIATLPDGRLPDRNDFVTYANDPATRINRWRQVLDRCSGSGSATFDVTPERVATFGPA